MPVAVGFGVSRPEHVKELAPATDGIIVGSAIVAALNDDGPAGVRRLVALPRRGNDAPGCCRNPLTQRHRRTML